jgi:hypothetical protein
LFRSRSRSGSLDFSSASTNLKQYGILKSANGCAGAFESHTIDTLLMPMWLVWR